MAKPRSKYDKRKSNQETLGEVIDRMLNVYRLRSGLTAMDLKQHWREIVGTAVASKTEEISLRGGKLYIKMNSAAMRQELHYQREDIASNVNTFLKSDVVTEVVLR